MEVGWEMGGYCVAISAGAGVSCKVVFRKVHVRLLRSVVGCGVDGAICSDQRA
jgi:hypothetical protein